MRIPRFLATLASAACLLASCSDSADTATDTETEVTTDLENTEMRAFGGINLERATIPDLQRAMHEGRLTSVRLTTFYLRQIRQLNPKLNAVIAVNPAALFEAEASDLRRRFRGTLGLM